MAATARDTGFGDVIKAYMKAHGVATHEEMAHILGVERSLVSKYITGARVCRDIVQLRRLAEAMDLPPEALGLLHHPGTTDPIPSETLAEWRLARHTLNRKRHALSGIAARLYWDAVRVEGTSCLSRPDWLATTPLELDSVQLDLVDDASAPEIDGSEAESTPMRPQRPDGSRFERYSEAIRAIAQPELFDNRTSYRLLEASFAEGIGRMKFGLTTYFDMVDVCEAMAHETAAAWMSRKSPTGLTLPELPFRHRVGDLFDTARRAVLPSINTLTIRRSRAGDTFFLHRRGSTSVTLAAGSAHIIPAGVFQPAAIGPWNIARDFSLWRNMIREFFEEFLNAPEHDGSRGTSVDYSAEPYRTFTEARRSGKVRIWCFGIGFDPLAPAGEILTAAVIDAETFDRIFGAMVSHNAEGEMYPSDAGTVGIRWSAADVRRTLNHEPLAPAAAACIALTWRYRNLLLS